MKAVQNLTGKTDDAARGFSLLEVVVATALLGLGLVAIMQVLAVSRRGQEAARGTMQALLAADRVITEFSLAAGLTPGTFQGQQGAYAYRVTVTPQFEVANPNTPKRLLCYLVQVKLSWREGDRPKTLELATMRTVTTEKSSFPGG